MFFLRNLVAENVTKGEPWLFSDFARIPEGIRKDKVSRIAWLQNPDTDYHCYSLFEGQNSSLRINDQNPAVFQFGVAGDYDIQCSRAEIEAALGRMGNLKPNWIETSLGDCYRLVWLFQRSWYFPSGAFAEFAQTKLLEFLPMEQLVGLDEGAMTPTRYLTNGGRWEQVHDKPLPEDLTIGWMRKIIAAYKWNSEKGVSMDPKVVADRLRETKDFPRFSDWPGDFVLGSQGPTFWIPGSISATSAIVREKGLYTFSKTAHALGKQFYSWSDLLGNEWVSQYETCRLGAAVKDIYYDGITFFVQSPGGLWHTENKDNLINELVVNRKLSRSIKKGANCSEVEEAICYIRNNQRVEGASSFAFFKKGLIDFNNGRYLNTHTREVIHPSSEPAIWAPDGNLPWLYSFLNQFFDPFEQLDYFLSWFSYYYVSCYNREPRSGQTLILAGPENVGKTFLNRYIIGKCVGGFTDASDFFAGKDSFNSELFDYAHFVMDDGSVMNDRNFLKRYAELTKKLSANQEFRCNGKYRKAGTVGWAGRPGITCNLDAESLGDIPRMDISNKRKTMLFKAAVRKLRFPPHKEMNQILDKELPYLCRYLLDYTIPEHCRPEDVRFGVIHYHEKSLMRTVQLSGESACFAEAVDACLKEWFTVLEPTAEYWEGTAVDLQRLMLADPAMREIMRSFPVHVMRKLMPALQQSGLFDIDMAEDRNRTYKIYRSSSYTKAKKSTLVATNSAKFERI